MAERKATNKYYPPEWDPSKGSINSYKKSHPLRDRARKIDQGIIIVRFELPFNIWCLQCDNHIGRGVRYNAEKSKIGNYYTSPIYKFRMKCHLCDNHFEIQTDPAKFDYIVLSGARKQAISLGGITLDGSTTLDVDKTKRDINDAMNRLERRVEDRINGKSKISELQELKNWRSRWDDSFSANQMVRRQFRLKRKSIEQRKSADTKLLKRTSLNLKLVRSNPSDTKLAKEMLLRSSLSIDSELEKKRSILASPLKTRLSTATHSSFYDKELMQESSRGKKVKIKEDFN